MLEKRFQQKSKNNTTDLTRKRDSTLTF